MHNRPAFQYVQHAGTTLLALCAAVFSCRCTNAGAECYRHTDCSDAALCQNGACVEITGTDSISSDSETIDSETADSEIIYLDASTFVDASYEDSTETSADTGSDTAEADTGSDSSRAAIANVCLDPGWLSTPEDGGDLRYAAIINRKVTFYLKNFLVDSGYGVLITMNDIPEDEIFAPSFDNEGDDEQARIEAMSPSDRLAACETWQADYIIAVHHNAVDDSVPNYIRVYYTTDWPEAATWASNTQHQLETVMWSGAEGSEAFGNNDFTVLKNASVPALMTFASFYSNPDERVRLNDNPYLENEASAIFNGFIETFGP